MFHARPLYLNLLLSSCIAVDRVQALPGSGIRSKLIDALSLRSTPSPYSELERRADQLTGINLNPNGTPFLWLPDTTYSGKTFFDDWDFFTDSDPTSGNVDYVNKSTAIQNGYIFVQDDGTVIMKVDDTTTLPMGVNRPSVRITSQRQYNTGLFILDINRAPWGCGESVRNALESLDAKIAQAIWPAFWTVGGNWPANGEIDILEGVHDNQQNQISWHTNAGCMYDPSAQFTGTIPSDPVIGNHTDCDANKNSNSGCNVIEMSRASYGPYFESQGGGILAMKWDENDISIWSFYRAAIPTDITAGTPNPSLWGLPSAKLMNTMCNIPKFFANHSIVFDITFCGDWAGNSYASSGCPGTCAERIMDPANFVNATWSINSLKVFKKTLLSGANSIPSSATPTFTRPAAAQVVAPSLVAAVLFLSVFL
ncbi:hypothetical protein CPC08DRAFT_695392 [Agrocybe pediades]|nr:hypothetical protein CPC08DRAFT_695392 [Agrocybe pediades]